MLPWSLLEFPQTSKSSTAQWKTSGARSCRNLYHPVRCEEFFQGSQYSGNFLFSICLLSLVLKQEGIVYFNSCSSNMEKSHTLLLLRLLHNATSYTENLNPVFCFSFSARLNWSTREQQRHTLIY